MDFQTWEPVYEGLLASFGYPRDGDERARDRLGELLDDSETYDPATLTLDGKAVAIAGAGPSLEREADRAAEADAVLAASTAVDRLHEYGVAVDAMVTDLDKNPETGRELTEAGTPVFAHAHGDNVPAVEEHVPTYDPAFVVPTTLAGPTGRPLPPTTSAPPNSDSSAGTSRTRTSPPRNARNSGGPSGCCTGWNGAATTGSPSWTGAGTT